MNTISGVIFANLWPQPRAARRALARAAAWAGLLVGAAGCGPAPAPPELAPPPAEAPRAPAADAPDLVLIGVAGLRVDPAAEAGDAFLQPFADQPGSRFSAAYAQSPSTFVSLASLLGGRYPSALPICGFPSDASEATTEAPWCTSFPATTPSLPAVLRVYGYRTALIVSEVQGAERFAGQFDELIVVGERHHNSDADWAAVSAAAQAWWARDEGRPRFLAVVTSDLNVRTRPELREAWGLVGVDDGRAPPPPDRPRIFAGYRAAAAGVGAEAAALLSGLGSGGRPRWAALIGVNGINLGETPVRTQALRDRSWSDILIDRTLHVPLALLGPPGTRSQQVDEIVELVDILPTFLGLAGAVLPAGASGQDLLHLPPAAPPGDPAAPAAYAEFGDMLALRQGSRMWSVRAFHFNRSALDPELTDFVIAYQPDPSTGYLHDLARDPFQEDNLLLRDPAGARALHAALISTRTGPAAPPTGALDARKIWSLRTAPADGYW